MAKKILIFLIAILTIFSLILFGCGKSEVLEETTKEESETDKGEVFVPQKGKVTFNTEDDITISGNVFGTGKKWVILTHMLQRDQSSWFDFAEFLVENGYTVLTYDLRGIGRSGGSMYDKGGPDTYLDLEAALDFVRQYDAEKIFLIGASIGGTLSLKVASKEPVDGVISISGPEEFQDLSVIDEIADITPPKLFIVSSGDTSAAESANNLYEDSLEPKDIKILEGNAHGTSILESESENSETVKQIILDFLNNN